MNISRDQAKKTIRTIKPLLATLKDRRADHHVAMLKGLLGSAIAASGNQDNGMNMMKDAASYARSHQRTFEEWYILEQFRDCAARLQVDITDDAATPRLVMLRAELNLKNAPEVDV